MAGRELEREGGIHDHAPQGRRASGQEGGARAPLDDDLVGACREMNVSSPDRVFIFDTTLRDGEQSPGFHLDANSKVRIARQLEKLGVDVIEAGFPVSSPGDFEACRRIAREIRGTTVTALARAVKEDIDAVWGAIKEAETPQIHIVLSVSDVHIDRKLGMTREQVLKRGAEMVT